MDREEITEVVLRPSLDSNSIVVIGLYLSRQYKQTNEAATEGSSCITIKVLF